MSTVLITGGTGFIGKALTQYLISKGHKVIVLSRKPKPKSDDGNVSYAAWDVNKQTIDENAIRNADYIVHLAGANLFEKRWTRKRKMEIRDSRIQSSLLLVKSIKEIPNRIKAVVSASAIGWYGDDKFRKKIISDKPFTENDPPAKGFLGETCKLWEESIEGVKELGVRLTKFRFGIVLGENGGALSEFKKSIDMGIAAIPGDGKQVISWIDMDDLCRLLLYAIENERIHGTYNAVAPNPITTKELVLQLAKKIRNKSFITMHAPQFMLKLLMGEMGLEILKSTTVSSAKIQSEGFTFIYPSIQSAL